MRLEKLLESLDAQASITHDTAHGKSIDWVVAGNRENADAIRHNYMLALTQDAKAGLFQSSNSAQMFDAGYLGHD